MILDEKDRLKNYRWFPLGIDFDNMSLMVAETHTHFFSENVFLNPRSVANCKLTKKNLDWLIDKADGLPALCESKVGFVFHTGFAGSTLLTRVFDRLFGVLSSR